MDSSRRPAFYDQSTFYRNKMKKIDDVILKIEEGFASHPSFSETMHKKVAAEIKQLYQQDVVTLLGQDITDDIIKSQIFDLYEETKLSGCFHQNELIKIEAGIYKLLAAQNVMEAISTAAMVKRIGSNLSDMSDKRHGKLEKLLRRAVDGTIWDLSPWKLSLEQTLRWSQVTHHNFYNGFKEDMEELILALTDILPCMSS